IVVIDIQITLKQMLRDFIGIRVNRAKKSGMVNITSSVNSRERSGINTILHELNPLFTINVTMKIGRASCREREQLVALPVASVQRQQTRVGTVLAQALTPVGLTDVQRHASSS